MTKLVLGDTLLRAEYKVGVAMIMATAKELICNADVPLGPICIALIPEEEIGRGFHVSLSKDLQADFVYTFNGGAVGEIDYETFLADGAIVKIQGILVSPRSCQRQNGQCHRFRE